MTGKPYRLIRAYGGKTHQWDIEEYGYVNRHGVGTWFDDFRGGKLIDAKQFPDRWIGADGRFRPYQAKQMLPRFVQDARDQITIVGGEYPIEWPINSPQALRAWITYLEEHGYHDVLNSITFR